MTEKRNCDEKGNDLFSIKVDAPKVDKEVPLIRSRIEQNYYNKVIRNKLCVGNTLDELKCFFYKLKDGVMYKNMETRFGKLDSFLHYDLSMISVILEEFNIVDKKHYKYIVKNMFEGFSTSRQTKHPTWRKFKGVEWSKFNKKKQKNVELLFYKGTRILKKQFYTAIQGGEDMSKEDRCALVRDKINREVDKGWLVCKGSMLDKKIWRVAPMFGKIEVKKSGVKKARVLCDARPINLEYSGGYKIILNDIRSLPKLFQLLTSDVVSKNDFKYLVSKNKSNKVVNYDGVMRGFNKVPSIKNVFIILIDLKDAFRQFKSKTTIATFVDGDEYKVYDNKTLPQGSCNSVAAFQNIAELIKVILGVVLNINTLMYLDDLVCILEYDSCILEKIYEVLRQIGIEANPDKTEICKVDGDLADFLGYSIGLVSKNGLPRLVVGYQKKRYDGLVAFIDKRILDNRLNFKDFESVRGKVSFMESFVVRPYEMDFIYSLNECRFNKCKIGDVLLALQFCVRHMPMVKFTDVITGPLTCVFTDASLTHLGWCVHKKNNSISDVDNIDIYKCNNVMLKIKDDEDEYSIRMLEALALYLYILRERGKNLLIFVDNQNVIFNMVRASKQTDKMYITLIKGINKIIIDRGMNVVIVYVRSKANRADVMTRTDILDKCPMLVYTYNKINVEKTLEKIFNKFKNLDI